MIQLKEIQHGDEPEADFLLLCSFQGQSSSCCVKYKAAHFTPTAFESDSRVAVIDSSQTKRSVVSGQHQQQGKL